MGEQEPFTIEEDSRSSILESLSIPLVFVGTLAIAAGLVTGFAWAALAVFGAVWGVQYLALRGALRKAEGARQTDATLHELQMRVEQLLECATEDTLSGAGNARQFEIDWWRALARFHRRAEPFSVAVLDVVDAFQSTRQLPIGALHAAAGRLINTARAEDSVCRMNGATFAVLLSGTSRAGALRFVERARVALSAEPETVDGTATYFTVYGGVSEWRPELRSIPVMLAEAEDDKKAFGSEHRRQASYFEAV